MIECPAAGCSVSVDELTITNLISDPIVLKKYEYLVAKTFVQGNRLIKWCPAPGCENVVRCQMTRALPVKCNCGMSFCFKCSQAWHEPLSFVRFFFPSFHCQL
jgi:ariadne-1